MQVPVTRTIDEAAIAVKVAKIVESFPNVVYIRFDLGHDWTDDPSIFFRIILKDGAAHPKCLFGYTQRIEEALRKHLDQDIDGLQDYYSYRSQTEQTTLKDPAWEPK
jgi:hypothetical protein